ncbi:MAG: acyl-CoA thioester hydrolase/BAAT C-terminal domain-containing protein [Reyranella sp.]|uniref:acyl-CoA thioester hydrolase/BAAT C-terminal domain-containing protein n=1 Tax=Reyranella sp. TaxID=1929291 RepID=UPI003D0F2C28
MNVDECALAAPLQGVLLVPDRPNGLGIVVLGGSSGSVNVERARLFAQYGAVAIALRWFGGEGQSPGICEVPIESFTPATDKLVEAGCNRIAYLGMSKGAEAALLVAVHDPRIDFVIAVSPTSVVWANAGVGLDGAGLPLRSSWTLQGNPLPFISYDVSRMPAPQDGLMHFRAYHEESLARFAEAIPAASIPVERSRATFVLVAGADDALWPSDRFAASLAERLAAAGSRHLLVTHPHAGHRIVLPGETATRSRVNAHGGTDEADRELGRAAWDAIVAVCGLGSARPW